MFLYCFELIGQWITIKTVSWQLILSNTCILHIFLHSNCKKVKNRKNETFSLFSMFLLFSYSQITIEVLIQESRFLLICCNISCCNQPKSKNYEKMKIKQCFFCSPSVPLFSYFYKDTIGIFPILVFIPSASNWPSLLDLKIWLHKF